MERDNFLAGHVLRSTFEDPMNNYSSKSCYFSFNGTYLYSKHLRMFGIIFNLAMLTGATIILADITPITLYHVDSCSGHDERYHHHHPVPCR